MTAQGIFKALGHTPIRAAVRHARDWYPTPPWVVTAFLELEASAIRAHGLLVWEPAAGDGAMLGPLVSAGFTTVATDIEPMAAGIDRLDFLQAHTALAPIIVTNPPYRLCSPRSGGAPFAERALRLGVAYMALLLPANWAWAGRRSRLLEEFPLARIRPISRRIDWDGRGSPSQDHAWHVWDKDHVGPTHFVRGLAGTGEPRGEAAYVR